MSSSQLLTNNSNVVPLLTDSLANGLVNRFCRELLNYRSTKTGLSPHAKVPSRRGAYQRQLEKLISGNMVIHEYKMKKNYSAIVVTPDINVKGRIKIVLLIWDLTYRDYLPQTVTILCATKHFMARYIQRTVMCREELPLTRKEAVIFFKSALFSCLIAKYKHETCPGREYYLPMPAVFGLAIGLYDDEGVLVLKTFLRLEQLNDSQMNKAKCSLVSSLKKIEDTSHKY